jgi:O-methyltransferase domain/Dimerisation domain
MTQETDDLPDAAKLMQLVFGGYVQSQVIYVAVRLGIVDALADGPKDAGALATATKAHAPTLRRLMRVLTALGLSDEGADGRYSLTPQGGLLRADVRGSLRMPVLFGVGDWYWRAWGEFLHTVQTGEPAFDHVWGMNAFEFWGRNPEAGEVHDRGMATLTAYTTAAILEAYDFSRFRSVIDVGGGTGTLLAAILQKHPTLRGMLFDLPHVIERAPDVLRAAGVSDRCELAAGSFFEGVPGGHDAYLLKWIIHDWDDARAIAILRACHGAMSGRGTLLLVERVLGDRTTPAELDHYRADLLMAIATPGGKERTRREFEVLFDAAGFRLAAVVPTRSPMSVIEAVAR